MQFLYSFDDFNLLDDDMIQRKPCVLVNMDFYLILSNIVNRKLKKRTFFRKIVQERNDGFLDEMQ